MAETKKTTTKKTTTKKTTTTKKVEAPKGYPVKVNVHALNVRKTHGYGADVVKVIPVDTACEIIETEGNWGKLSTGEGWICLDFVVKI